MKEGGQFSKFCWEFIFTLLDLDIWYFFVSQLF